VPHASRLLDYASPGLIIKRKEPRAAFSGVLVERRLFQTTATDLSRLVPVPPLFVLAGGVRHPC